MQVLPTQIYPLYNTSSWVCLFSPKTPTFPVTVSQRPYSDYWSFYTNVKGKFGYVPSKSYNKMIFWCLKLGAANVILCIIVIYSPMDDTVLNSTKHKHNLHGSTVNK